MQLGWCVSRFFLPLRKRWVTIANDVTGHLMNGEISWYRNPDDGQMGVISGRQEVLLITKTLHLRISCFCAEPSLLMLLRRHQMQYAP